ncbi:hypothetical protein ILYODFUR_001930 [Ilyodon furcidens]|uniref:Uncharacterized protein n=1 Tax=Ilyodon furcidens TaxID=33524 RepID=A0ABV0URA4_9TELE
MSVIDINGLLQLPCEAWAPNVNLQRPEHHYKRICCEESDISCVQSLKWTTDSENYTDPRCVCLGSGYKAKLYQKHQPPALSVYTDESLTLIKYFFTAALTDKVNDFIHAAQYPIQRSDRTQIQPPTGQ